MMREIISENAKRGKRWFSDEYFDLIVWEKDGSIFAFQLCYNKGKGEHALSWGVEDGFTHNKIDAGEDSVLKNMTPLLVADGSFDNRMVAEIFSQRSGNIDKNVAQFIADKIQHCMIE